MMATGESERSPALVEVGAKRVEAELLVSPHRLRIFDHGRSDLDLPVDSEIHKAKERWHHAVECSREEVVRYLRSVEAEFQIPGERTPAGKSLDWRWGLYGEGRPRWLTRA